MSASTLESGVSSRSAGGASRRRRPWLGHLLLGGLLGGGVLFVAVMFFGLVEGEEFCPQSFQRRAYSYFQIPLINLQVSPRDRRHVGSTIADHLQQQSWLPFAAATPRWDLVLARRNQRLIREGDARLLCRYLDAVDRGGSVYWLEWSQTHPQLAQVFWPTVAELAQRQMYFFLPELFQLAQEADDPNQLQTEIRATLADRYSQLANSQEELGMPQLARMLYDEALRYVPEHAAARQGRTRLESAGGGG